MLFLFFQVYHIKFHRTAWISYHFLIFVYQYLNSFISQQYCFTDFTVFQYSDYLSYLSLLNYHHINFIFRFFHHVISFLIATIAAEVIYHAAPIFEDHSMIKYIKHLTDENFIIPIWLACSLHSTFLFLCFSFIPLFFIRLF